MYRKLSLRVELAGTYGKICYHHPIRSVFRHGQLIYVLREFGAVVIGINDDDCNCGSGPEFAFSFIYGDHLNHQRVAKINPKRFQNDKLTLARSFTYLENHLLFDFIIEVLRLLHLKLNINA